MSAAPGDRVTMPTTVHTRTGTESLSIPVVVVARANAAGMLRVRAEGDAAARFGRMHWLAEGDAGPIG